MILKSILVPTVVVPMVIALAILLADALLVRRGRERSSDFSIAGLAVALAFLAGFVAMTGWPRWPPVQSTHRLFFAVVAAGALAPLLSRFVVLSGPSKSRPGVRMLIAGVLFAIMLRFLLHAPIQNSWTASQTGLWLAGLTLVGLALLFAFERSLDHEANHEADVEPDWSFRSLLPAILRLTLLGLISVTLGMSDTARLAQLLGATACGVTAVEIIGRLAPRGRGAWQPSDALPLTTILLGLLVCAHFYAELSLIAFGLIVVACLVLGAVAGLERRWLMTVAIIPLLVALSLTANTYFNQPENPYLDYYPADE